MLGMIRENWRSALPSRAQPRRKDLEILHPSDQMSEVQGWPDAKPGLSRRRSATGQLAGLLKMNVDCFLCLESFSGSPSPPRKSPSLLCAALSCPSCISSFSFHLCHTGFLSLPGNLLAPSYLRAFAHAVPATWSSFPTSSHGYFLSVPQFSSQMS